MADVDGRPEGASAVAVEGGEVWIAARPSSAGKCVRCWHHRADVGHDAGHPELCGRCVQNVVGSGELRQWF